MAEYEYIGDGRPDGTVIGRASTEKIGFYGTTPIVKATVSLGAGTTTTLLKGDVLTLHTALANLGLIA